MYDRSLREEVQKSVELLGNRLSELQSSGTPFDFPTNYDLVLDIVETEDKKTIRQYYFVDHNTRTLFWLDFYEVTVGCQLDIPGVKEHGHISKWFFIQHTHSSH
jgi:hypothetical protein